MPGVSQQAFTGLLEEGKKVNSSFLLTAAGHGVAWGSREDENVSGYSCGSGECIGNCLSEAIPVEIGEGKPGE